MAMGRSDNKIIDGRVNRLDVNDAAAYMRRNPVWLRKCKNLSENTGVLRGPKYYLIKDKPYYHKHDLDAYMLADVRKNKRLKPAIPEPEKVSPPKASVETVEPVIPKVEVSPVKDESFYLNPEIMNNQDLSMEARVIYASLKMIAKGGEVDLARDLAGLFAVYTTENDKERITAAVLELDNNGFIQRTIK